MKWFKCKNVDDNIVYISKHVLENITQIYESNDYTMPMTTFHAILPGRGEETEYHVKGKLETVKANIEKFLHDEDFSNRLNKELK